MKIVGIQQQNYNYHSVLSILQILEIWFKFVAVCFEETTVCW